MGIKLDNDTDGVVGMDLVSPGSFLWSITDNGLAKATPIDDYPLQNRYGQGVINVRLPKGASEVVAATLLTRGASLIVTTSGGVTKKLGLSDTTIGTRSVRPQPALVLAAKSRVTGAVLPSGNGASEKKPAAADAAPSRRAKPATPERADGDKVLVQQTLALEEAPPAAAAPKKAAPKKAASKTATSKTAATKTTATKAAAPRKAAPKAETPKKPAAKAEAAKKTTAPPAKSNGTPAAGPRPRAKATEKKPAKPKKA
jgi:hypothetical protein